MAPPNRRHGSGAADRSMACRGVESDQNEPGDVLSDGALGDVVAHDLPRPPSRPQQSRGLVAGEPIGARDRALVEASERVSPRTHS
jgi:hypothetical protein